MFDLLLDSQKPLTAGEVAQKLGTSGDGIERLLDLLVAIEILEVELIQGTGGVFCIPAVCIFATENVDIKYNLLKRTCC